MTPRRRLARALRGPRAAGRRAGRRLAVLGLAAALGTIPATGAAGQTQPESPVPVILDTDFGGDADDLGALVMLHRLMDRGEAELLAVMSWSTERYTVPAIDAVNRYYGHGDVPIGSRKDGLWHEPWTYGRAIVEAWGSRRTAEDVPATTPLYRRILAGRPDGSVTVVTIGPLLNLLRLLESGPDSLSRREGRALVAAKVREVVIMGGEFPAGSGEWNFSGGMPGVTRAVLSALAEAGVPTTFVGYEVGVRIRTGRALNDAPRSPLSVGYRHFSEHAPWMRAQFSGEILDNASYDQVAVLYAVRAGVGAYFTRVDGGHVAVTASGDSRWVPGPPILPQSYLELRADPEELATVIESLMLGG